MKTDPELEAALRAVADSPLDEGRRRVLADLLLERGDPRGEFLLLQFLISANQASGAVRQRAQELWKRHRHEWMRGLEVLFTDLQLENGFPARATLGPNLDAEQRAQLLAAPMFSTLRSLDAGDEAGEAVLVAAATGPRFLGLSELTLRTAQAFSAIAAGGVPGRLRRLELRFTPSLGDLELLVRAAPFASLRSLAVQLATFHGPRPRRRGVAGTLRELFSGSAKSDGGFGTRLLLLGQHPALERVELLGVPMGSFEGFAAVAAAWPRLPFQQVSAAGTLELAREADGGATLLLQNLTVDELLRARPLVPAGVTRARLMRRRSGVWERHEELEKVRAAWEGLTAGFS